MRALAARVVPVLLLALFPILLLAGPALAAPGDPIPVPEKGTIEADCGLLDIGCQAGQVAGNIAGDALSDLADAINEAVGNVVKSLGTVWVNIGTPDLTGSGVAGWLTGELAFYTGLMAVISVLIGAAKTALRRKSEPAKDLARSLLTLVVVNSVLVSSIAGLVVGGDAFAKYIIDQSTAGTDFGANITTMLRLSNVTPLGNILVIVLGLMALFASLMQIVLMVARGGLLVIVIGVLPLSSSFTNTAVGKHWHQKMIGWTVAALLYKPAAAIVYAVAFRLTGANVFGDDGLTAVLTGVLLMVMALLALPALMTLAFPAVSAVSDRASNGSGGAMAVGAVATGAQVIQLRSGSGSGSGSGGQATPASSPAGAQIGGTGSSGPAGASTTGTSGGPGPAGAAGATGTGAAGAAGAASGVVGGVAAVGQAAVSKAKSTATDAASGPTGGQQ